MLRTDRRIYLLGGIAALITTTAVRPAAAAQKRQQIDLPRQRLADELRAVGRATGRDVMFASEAVGDRPGQPIHGLMTADEAVDLLLSGTDLVADHRDDVILIRGRVQDGGATVGTLPSAIVVTGTRIRGAPVASPTIVLSAKALADQGYATLADAVRQIPQNFPGSQNPGAGFNVPEKNGSYIGASSSFDLRGIGGDATLTLLNGHRLAYNGAYQAIDISTIPLAALDRVDIVTDGSSALYGSDAVAGVANILLRRDFDGMTASARVGGSTSGGNLQQQYDLTVGRKWQDGGFMLAFDHSDTSAINADNRSYARSVSPGLTLLPHILQNSLVGTAHQSYGWIDFSIDGFYNSRRSGRFYAITDAGQPAVDGGGQLFRSASFSISPQVDVHVGAGWTLDLQGSYSRDASRYHTYYVLGGVKMYPTTGCYCNQEHSAEAHAEGPLFHLPGGDARLAIGGGLRSAGYHGYRTEGSPQDINVRQDTYFGYGEINLPVVASGNAVALVHRLDVSGAVRFEDYPGIDKVVTPKLGLVYSPIEDIDFKATWGRSFKAPTFYERYSEQSVTAYDIDQLGGAGFPAGTTGLDLAGGNPKLKPERATTWSASLALHPRTLRGFEMQLSYFGIHYKDRIVDPITYLSTAISDPANAQFVTLDPSADAIAETLAGRPFGDISTLGYDPTRVGAIVDEINVNAARQTISGVDLAATYATALSGSSKLEVTGSATYLKSRERLDAALPEVALAGTLFNPPHVRARAGATWSDSATTISSFVNYAGHVRDIRAVPSESIRGMTTWDTSLSRHITLPAFGPRRLDLSLAAMNLLNQKPARIATTAVYETPYDPLNGSPTGRFVSLTVSVTW